MPCFHMYSLCPNPVQICIYDSHKVIDKRPPAGMFVGEVGGGALHYEYLKYMYMYTDQQCTYGNKVILAITVYLTCTRTQYNEDHIFLNSHGQHHVEDYTSIRHTIRSFITKYSTEIEAYPDFLKFKLCGCIYE